MKRALLIAILALSLCLALVGTVSAQVKNGASITGNIVNGTQGGMTPQSGMVIAHFHNAEKWTDDLQTQLSPNGTFAFYDLTSQVGLSYIIEFSYLGVSYYSPDADLLTQNNPPVVITVYETTSNRADLGIGMGYIGITPGDGVIHVEEDYWVNNLGDHTYVDIKHFDNSSTILGFSLPANATNLVFTDPAFGGKDLTGSAATIDAFSVHPGESSMEITYAYDLPDNGDFTFSRSYSLPVNSLQVTMYSSSLGLQGSGLQLIGQSDTVGGHSSTFQMSSLSTGQLLSFTFVPLSTVLAQSPSYRTATIGGIILLLLSVLLSFGIWISKSTPPMPYEVQPLIKDLAKVEAEHQSRSIPDKVYRRERADLREQIKKRLKKLSKGRS